ncbi:MAG TPA: cell wall-active antibiotics response protein LiaF [Anaerolineae bacterium]|nr:cell wall-active antibiotics response protein LiaF [Anaerolineae bacterium]
MNNAIERPRVLLGFVLVLIGGLYLLSNLGLLRGFSIWGILWGLFWLWLGAVVVAPRGRGVGAARLTLGLGFILIGAFTLADGMGLIDFSFGFLLSRFWPLVLIVIGVLILYETNRGRTVRPSVAADRLEYDSIFGDFKLTQPGWELRNLRATTVIGDMKIDLSKAHIPEGETTIDLNGIIGDIDVWAPADLPVALDAQCTFVTVSVFGRKQDVILRRYSDVPAAYEAAPRRVRLRASLIFGDLNVVRAG